MHGGGMTTLNKRQVFVDGAGLGLVIDVMGSEREVLGTLYGVGRVGGDAVDLVAYPSEVAPGSFVVESLTADGAVFVELMGSGSV